jgi:hypothetical protein
MAIIPARFSTLLRFVTLVVLASWPQAQGQVISPGSPESRQAIVPAEGPDAERTREQLHTLLQRYPPAVRRTLSLDPSLLSNQTYMGSYPALDQFIAAHPEVAHNPSYFLGFERLPMSAQEQAAEFGRDIMKVLAVFTGFGMAIGVIIWLIRTFIDYRRWSRLVALQTNVHTKLLDRFTSNEDLLAYMRSPAGDRFLQSSPIALDAAPRSLGAPVGRILWSIQGGVVLIAGGAGLQIIGRSLAPAGEPVQALGVLALALGVGFIISAGVSYLISKKLGLLERASRPLRTEVPEV